MSKFKRGDLVWNPNTKTVILVGSTPLVPDEFTGMIVQSDDINRIGNYRDDWNLDSFKSYTESVTIVPVTPLVGTLYGDADDGLIFAVLSVDNHSVEGIVIRSDTDDLFAVGDVATFDSTLYVRKDI